METNEQQLARIRAEVNKNTEILQLLAEANPHYRERLLHRLGQETLRLDNARCGEFYDADPKMFRLP